LKAVIQRVSHAQVSIKAEIVAKIDMGLLVLLGVAAEDEESDASELADKICGLRIFSDVEGKMNLSIKDVGGSMLIVSQFTLLADTRRGRRPSFIGAAAPSDAIPLYERFIQFVDSQGIPTATGQFGADMAVQLVNDGPVTLILESRGGGFNKAGMQEKRGNRMTRAPGELVVVQAGSGTGQDCDDVSASRKVVHE